MILPCAFLTADCPRLSLEKHMRATPGIQLSDLAGPARPRIMDEPEVNWRYQGDIAQNPDHAAPSHLVKNPL